MVKRITSTVRTAIGKASGKVLKTTVRTPKISATASSGSHNTGVDKPDFSVVLAGYGETSVPTAALPKYLGDAYASADYVGISFGKLNSDTASVATVLVFGLGKLVENTSVSSDTVSSVVHWRRYVEENTPYAESDYYADDYNALQFQSVDVLAMGLSRPLNEAVGGYDSMVKTVGKNTSDTQSVGDSYNRTISKPFTEAGVSTDTVSYTAVFHRTVSDVLNATDDYMGNANADDDVYSVFGKGVAEASLSYDVNFFNTVKVLFESTISQEALSSNTSKPYHDPTLTSDQVASAATKVSADNFSADDSVTAHTQNYVWPDYVEIAYLGQFHSM